MDGKIEKAVLRWVGVDSFVLRLLAMAQELHGSLDEAHEVFCTLRGEGYFSLKTAADMPRGAAAKHYRCVSAEEMILERIRLAPKLGLKDSRLAEFVLRDCLYSLRQVQASTEVYLVSAGDDSDCSQSKTILCHLYQGIAQTLRDFPELSKGLWTELDTGCEELKEQETKEACRLIIEKYR